MADLTFPRSRPVYGSYEWFQREIGTELGFGANPSAWDDPKIERVDSLIQRGIQAVYLPPFSQMPDHQNHRWSFLRPLTSITLDGEYSTGTVTIVLGVVTLAGGTWPTWAADGELLVAGVSYPVNTRDSGTQLTLNDLTVAAGAGTIYGLQRFVYDLPSDFGGIDGPFTFQRGTSSYYPPVPIVPLKKIETALMEWETSDRPRWAALVPKQPAGGVATIWQVKFFPAADSAYTLFYQYRAYQGPISAGQYPLGGIAHYDTILYSCLAVQNPNYMPMFLAKLEASIAVDQMEFAPETLGLNRDHSDNVVGSDGPLRRDEVRNYVTVDGVLYD